MIGSRNQLLICLGLGVLLSPLTLGQDDRPDAVQSTRQEAREYADRVVSLWMKALFASPVEQSSLQLVDQLSALQLSASQIKKLILASEQETSETKRVLLWQAIRTSRDLDGRDFLIRTLLEKCTPELQIQFLEGFRDPTPFDVPILASLYNSYRNRKQDSDTLKDVFDVPLKVLELTCHCDWNSSLIDNRLAPSSREINATEELRSKWMALDQNAWREAEIAQSEMVRWLIEHGLEDRHRLIAFRKFLASERSGKSRIVAYGYGQALLKGLDHPESRAQAIWLVSGSVDPSTFLAAHEAEVVRLSAIDAMGRMVYECRKNQVLIFREKIALYKPLLAALSESDVSVDVRKAIKKLQEFIAEYEMM